MSLLLVQPHHLVPANAACRMQPVERCEREACGVKLISPSGRPRPHFTHCSVEMPSKHFLRCGCTRVGSLVLLRISSISSFDRKKKRGKAMRLSSR